MRQFVAMFTPHSTACGAKSQLKLLKKIFLIHFPDEKHERDWHRMFTERKQTITTSPIRHLRTSILLRKARNSCHRSCAHRQGPLCLQLRADEAKGSIQWKMTLFVYSFADTCDKSHSMHYQS